jgi:hypothetical protein
MEFKIPAFGPFPGLPVTCYDKHLSLPMHINNTWEFTNRKISCNPQYTQVYRVSHFNRTGIELTAFLILFARSVAFLSSNADRMGHCQNHITIKENSGQSILEFI